MTKTIQHTQCVEIQSFGLEASIVPKGNLFYYLPVLMLLSRKEQDHLLFKLSEFAHRGEKNARKIFSAKELALLCSMTVFVYPTAIVGSYMFHENARDIIMGSIAIDESSQAFITNPVVDKESAVYKDVEILMRMVPKKLTPDIQI